MARDLNRWTGIGRLGKDIELRYLPNGDAVANFSIACSDSWKDKQSGEAKEVTEWVNLVAFKQLAEICGQFLKKGSRIYAEGKLTTRKWQDKDGKDRYTTEIRVETMQMLDGKSNGDEPPQRARAASPQPAMVDDDPSDIPF